MKEIIIGILILFNTISVIQFWKWFIWLDKTKQIKVNGIMEEFDNNGRRTSIKKI